MSCVHLLPSYISDTKDANELATQDYQLLKAKFAVISKSADSTEQSKIKDEIVRKVALLLKHDWERAKSEAGVRIKPYHVGLGIIFVYFLYPLYSNLLGCQVAHVTSKVTFTVIAFVFFYYSVIWVRKSIEKSKKETCGKKLLGFLCVPLREPAETKEMRKRD